MAGEMDWWDKVCTALPEDRNSVPSTHLGQLTIASYGQSDALFWPLQLPTLTLT